MVRHDYQGPEGIWPMKEVQSQIKKILEGTEM